MIAAVLASDMGRILDPLYPPLGWGVVLYLSSLLSAKVISRRPWLWGFLLAAVWGVLFPVFQLVLLLTRQPQFVTLWVEILPASVITAALLGWASRSPLPPAGVAIGYVLACALFSSIVSAFDEAWSGLLASLPWHIGVATGLLVWALRERRNARYGVDRCPACGYDLSGLPTRTCPECGDTARPSAPPLFRAPGNTP